MNELAAGFVCPACRSPVETKDDRYECARCGRSFPVLFGIPDFRLNGDLYLSLEEERAKAGKLHDYAQGHGFAALVSYYYSITDDVPAGLATAFTAYLLDAPARAQSAIDALADGQGGSLLDLGCGSGGALVAARPAFGRSTGVDVALRWLVIAKKRIEEGGISADLVCADAEALPFADGTFTHLLAKDLLEHTRSPSAAIASAAAMLKAGGRLYISAANSRWIGPDPATGVWAAGLLPARLRGSVLKRRHGADILRAVSFVTPGSVLRMARAAGFKLAVTGPHVPEMGHLRGRPADFRFLARCYSVLAQLPVARTVLLIAGPVFRSIFVKERST